VNVDPFLHFWSKFQRTQNRPMVIQDFLFRMCYIYNTYCNRNIELKGAARTQCLRYKPPDCACTSYPFIYNSTRDRFSQQNHVRCMALSNKDNILSYHILLGGSGVSYIFNFNVIKTTLKKHTLTAAHKIIMMYF
jgi:hypothetical protein